MPASQLRSAVVEHRSYREPMCEVVSSLRDGDLVEQAQARNQAAFEMLVEIDSILRIPETTAKTYFQGAKLRLRQSLGQVPG